MCESKDFKSNIYVNKKAAQKDFMELYEAFVYESVCQDADTTFRTNKALAKARRSPLFKKGGDAQCRIAKKKKG